MAGSLAGMAQKALLADITASRQLDIERKGKKADRGFNHPATAALLCPMKYMAIEE